MGLRLNLEQEEVSATLKTILSDAGEQLAAMMENCCRCNCHQQGLQKVDQPRPLEGVQFNCLATPTQI